MLVYGGRIFVVEIIASLNSFVTKTFKNPKHLLVLAIHTDDQMIPDVF